MRYYLLFALVSLASYAAVSLLMAFAMAAAAPVVRRRLGARPAAQRAKVLATARLLPVASGLSATLLFASVFARFEPRDTAEVPGLLLLALALFTTLLSVAAAARLAGSVRASVTCSGLLQQCGRRWARDDGHPVWLIDSAYPVAAVTGLFRTRLLISTRIVRECTPSELDAVIRHEAAHVRRRDNLVRAAMRYLPDPFLLFASGHALQSDWAAAAEEAADDEAAGPRAEARSELAAALVRVARMAEGPPPRWMPALAFYEGTNLENRVRRLLGNGGSVTRTSPLQRAIWTVVLVSGATLAAGAASEDLHALMELAVRYLP